MTLLSFTLQSCSVLRLPWIQSPKPDPSFELTSTAGVDYAPLQTSLKRQRWQDADRETFRALLKMSSRETEGWLDRASVEALSCTDLHTLARAWDYYSDGRFGFIRQQQIWEELGGVVGSYTPQIAEQFGDRVGWRQKGEWLTYDQLNFSKKASEGHLPATTGNGVSGGVWGGVPAITHRLKYCQLADALAQGQWVKADWETLTLFDAYRLPEEDSPDPSPLIHQDIPCHELKAVDQLWLKASNGRFGLSVQTDILKKTGNIPGELHWRRYEAFEKAVGWVIDVREDTYNGADPQTIPVGHFPYRLGYSYITYGSGFDRTWRLALDPSCGF
ncbi:MAG TPA: GUN4 domain-containing protein [Leptolyngbyaceae cyanobacterium]